MTKVIPSIGISNAGDGDNSIYAVIFLARDILLVPVLEFYRRTCEMHGADARQLQAVSLLIGRVERWQRANPSKLKLPDVTPGPQADRVCAPND